MLVFFCQHLNCDGVEKVGDMWAQDPVVFLASDHSSLWLSIQPKDGLLDTLSHRKHLGITHTASLVEEVEYLTCGG